MVFIKENMQQHIQNELNASEEGKLNNHLILFHRQSKVNMAKEKRDAIKARIAEF